MSRLYAGSFVLAVNNLMDINELQSYNLADAVKFNDKLNPKIWGQDEHMLPEVKKTLLRIADDFREFLGITDIELKDITVSGSNASYTYTDNSDVDLHLVVDLPQADASQVYRELFDAKKYQYNDQNDFKIGNYDIELYVQNANEPAVSQGIYSVLNNKWVSVPNRRKPKIDDISVKSKYEDIGHRIDQAIASDSQEQMDAIWHKIKEMRKAGLAKTGEFGPENLAFKILRNNGTLQKLIDARKAVKDREMSIVERSKTQSRVKYGHGHPLDQPTLTPQRLADKHGVSLDQIIQELERGIDIEKEHTTDISTAREIALDHLAELPDYYTRLAKVEVKEGFDANRQKLKEFIKFCVGYLELGNVPKIQIVKSAKWSQKYATFGRYDPTSNTLFVSIADRHPVDVMRTIAHELVHRKQDERSELPNDAGETGSEYENEANAVAGVIMREFGQHHPEYFVLAEAAYAGNLGVMKMMKFYQVASDRQKAVMHQLIKHGKKDLAWALLQKVTGVKLEKLDESSGYIPVNDAEARDPRYSMAVTADVKPGEPQRQAAKMGWTVDRAGVPPLLMSKLQNKLSIIKEGREIVNEEDLMEVAMSPGALIDWATSPAARGIQAGFEAELIFRDLREQDNSSDSDYEADWDADVPVESIEQAVEFFSNNDYGLGLSQQRQAQLRDRLTEQFHVWRDNQISELWHDVAVEQVRDYMEMNVWEDDALQQDLIMQELDKMGLSESEIDHALDAGDGNEQYDEAKSRAREEFETWIDSEINNEGDYYDAAREYFFEMMYDSGDFSEEEWFSRRGPSYTMYNLSMDYDLEWPVLIDNQADTFNFGGRTAEDIEASLVTNLDIEATVGRGYHSVKRRPGLWIIEPDSSLDADDENDAGLEIVSPPMPLIQALEKLEQIIQWAKGPGDAYTNSSTGLHMGISLPDVGGDVDYIKLILFMGDQYILEKFKRESNSYCKSALSKVKNAIRTDIVNPEHVLLTMKTQMNRLAGRYLSEPIGLGQDKYTSAHIKRGYIEFRSPGGDYISEYDSDNNVLQSTMLRLARAMSIAGDPEAEKQEYAKKLYKLVAPEGNDILKLFAQLAAGEISGQELKRRWSQQVIAKAEADADKPVDTDEEYNWEVYNTKTGEILARYTNLIHDDVRAKAREEFGDHPDRLYLKVRVQDPGNISPKRLKLARTISQTPMYWKVTSEDSGRTVIIPASDPKRARSMVANIDDHFYMAWIKNRLVVSPATKAEFEKFQQEQDNAQDSQRVQATVTQATQPAAQNWWSVTNNHGQTQIVQAPGHMAAGQAAMSRYPEIFPSENDIFSIRIVDNEEAESLGLNEGWRDLAIGAGLGAMALGGGSAAYDAYKSQEPTVQARTAQGQISQPIKQPTAQKKAAAPAAKQPAKQMGNLEKLVATAAQKAGIVGTELKQFLAQLAHESMNFDTLEEIGDDNYIAKKYDKKYNPAKAKQLGNTQVGDGVKYKGRGFIQLTGRYNYAKAGEALGLPLEQKPELAARPDVAAKIAVWFWKLRVQPKVKNFHDVKAATKPINPGLAGLQSRQAYYDKYAQASIPGVTPKKKV